jgi:hypothetical protein
MANTNETLETFAEKVRIVLGRSIADLGLGSRDRAINALGELLTKAEAIVHGSAMADESDEENEDRYALAGLAKLVDLKSEAPEIED